MFGFSSFSEVAFSEIYSQISPINIEFKGGFDEKKRKPKVYKDLRKEVEDDVSSAIDKFIEKNEKISLEQTVKQIEAKPEVKIKEDQYLQLQEQALKAQFNLLQAEIDRLILAELDDEESLMLLL
jgi:hypothetical protein